MHKWVLAGLLGAWILVSGGCASMHSERDSRRVTHVIVCWLKNPGDVQGRSRLIEEAHQLGREIPGLRKVVAGTSLPGERPQVDASFDVAVVMEFDDEAALRAYDKHPRHQQAVREVLRPLVNRFVVYDFLDR